MYISLLISLLFFVLSAVFALQNSTMAVVRFLLWQFNIQIALLILIAFFLGFLSHMLLSLPHRLKVKKKLFENKIKIKKLQEDLSKYRNMLLGSRKL
ncbi:MAG: LapA family protein [Elusimicrobia bacterium]|nr:LapA family protein [Elusimicrobiota bacterium]